MVKEKNKIETNTIQKINGVVAPEGNQKVLEAFSKSSIQRLKQDHNIVIGAAEAIPTLLYVMMSEYVKTCAEEALNQLSETNHKVEFDLFNILTLGVREEGSYNIQPYVKLGDETIAAFAKRSNLVGSIPKDVSVTTEDLEGIDSGMILNAVINKALKQYSIDPRNYRSKFENDPTYYSALAIIEQDKPMSIAMFKRWCDILELNPEFKVSL